MKVDKLLRCQEADIARQLQGTSALRGRSIPLPGYFVNFHNPEDVQAARGAGCGYPRKAEAEWNKSPFNDHQRERRESSSQAEAAARPRYPGRQQRRASAHAEAARPRRSVAVHGPSDRTAERQAILQSQERDDGAEAGREQGVQLGRRCTYLPAGAGRPKSGAPLVSRLGAPRGAARPI